VYVLLIRTRISVCVSSRGTHLYTHLHTLRTVFEKECRSRQYATEFQFAFVRAGLQHPGAPPRLAVGIQMSSFVTFKSEFVEIRGVSSWYLENVWQLEERLRLNLHSFVAPQLPVDVQMSEFVTFGRENPGCLDETIDIQISGFVTFRWDFVEIRWVNSWHLQETVRDV